MATGKRRLSRLQLKAGGILLILLLVNASILGAAFSMARHLSENREDMESVLSLEASVYQLLYLIRDYLDQRDFTSLTEKELAGSRNKIYQAIAKFEATILALIERRVKSASKEETNKRILYALKGSIGEFQVYISPFFTGALEQPQLARSFLATLESTVPFYAETLRNVAKLIRDGAGEELRFFLWLQYMFLGLTLAVAVLAVFLVHRLIQRPAMLVLKGMRDFADGNLSKRLATTSRDEMGEIASGFNTMAARLQELYTGLEQKVAERTAELNEKNLQLEAATRHKSEFLASMSHELRTPLNSIIGFSELMEDETFGRLNEKQKQYVQNVLASGEHLLSLINDILDLSKVEAGKMELRPEEFSLSEAFTSMIATVQALAAKKEILLEVKEPELTHLYADLSKFKQIMYNLLSNAIKFTPEKGRVTVEARAEGEKALISVSDTGIGIKPEDQENIFQEFKQLESGLARRHEGTGLGLALAKRFTEMHGGTIWVESQPGQGSTFTFTLPLSRPGEDKRPCLEIVKKDAPLILVVEDEPQASHLIGVCLTGAGYNVAYAYDGEEAVAAARKLHPVAITLDILLPKKDGWEVLRELKEDPELEAIPVVIVSILDNKELGFSLGATEYFVKPFRCTELLAKLTRLGFSPLTRERPTTVLVVDDEPQAVELLQAALVPAGYQVITASGGRDGIRLAKERRPDLILLDLLMPQVNGFQVVEALKQDPSTQKIPIIVVTAKEITQEDKDRLNGHIAALSKKGAFSQEDLLREIRNLPTLRRDSHGSGFILPDESRDFGEGEDSGS